MTDMPKNFGDGVKRVTGSLPASWNPTRPQSDRDSLFAGPDDVLREFANQGERAKIWIGEAIVFSEIIQHSLTPKDRFRLTVRGRRAIDAAKRHGPLT